MTNSEETPARRPGLATFRALGHRNYALYFAGQVVSLTGTWMQTAVLMWLVYQWTLQSRWSAWILAAQVGPTLVLGAWGGSLSDRLPRLALLLVTQSLLGTLGCLMAIVVGVGIESPVLILVLCLLNGMIVAVDFPARLAFVLRMVGKEDLTNAVALNALMFNLARMLGPVLAALLLPAVGAGACIALNALSYLAVLLALLAMDPARLLPEAPRLPSQPGDGWRYLRARPRLLLLLVLTGLLSMFGWPVLALLPGFVDRHLQGDHNQYSFLLSAIGLGALVAALTVATFGTAERRLGFLGAGVLLASGSLIALALAPTMALALLAAAGIGCGLIAFFATSQATTQLSAADHNRGFIMGVYGSVISGGQPLGNLLLGPLADVWPVTWVITLQGLAILLVGGIVGVLLLRSRS